ncbi:MAG TPA: AMP-binding protein, partial [Planctomycetota bacterium]|nr:AMP-binding protein [Planctomycetota bacterium]
MNLVELVLAQARARPQAPAIIAGERTLSFAELGECSARAAALFRQAGFVPGDAVLVFVPMGIDLYILLAGLWRVGLVALVVDPSAGRAHLARSVTRMSPKGFVGTTMAQFLRLSVRELRRIPRAWSTGFPWFCRRWSALDHQQPDERVESLSDDHPALVTFTSGSTGGPKGAVRTHGFLRAQHAAVSRSLDHQVGAMDLSTLPIFALANLASGQSVLIPDADVRRPGAIDPAPVLAQIARYRPRSAVASPAFFERLADGCDTGAGSIASFQAIFTGGAPVFPQLLERLQRLAPQAQVVAVYGSTEAEPIAEIAYRDMDAADLAAQRGGKGLLAGPVVTGIDLAILPDYWGTPVSAMSAGELTGIRLPAGVPGEITVAGDHVLSGYLGGAGDAETKFRVDGRIWHRTGDAGYLDERGRLWLLGRCGARITDARGTLYPFAVETAARTVTGICRAALVGLDGQRILAFESSSTGAPAELSIALAWAQLDRFVSMTIPLDR